MLITYPVECIGLDPLIIGNNLSALQYLHHEFPIILKLIVVHGFLVYAYLRSIMHFSEERFILFTSKKTSI